MLLRFRWFTLGILSSVGVMAFLAAQAKRARERLTRRALVRSGGRTFASLLDRAADRIEPSNEPQA